ncbi:MAG: hypothetical protein M3R53_03970, partial [Candidatus Eremiobacteraeota bacterium]|nr:hypothetical protein [Candidatus Eremiobacteraeota bacterium]
RSPVLVDGLAVGHHAVSITKTGWTVRDVEVTISATDIALSSTRLVASGRVPAGIGGSAVIHELPAGAALALDGRPFSGTPGRSISLSPGTHRVSMTTAHGRTTRSFLVVAETNTEVVLREARASDASAAVVAPAEDYLPTDAFSVTGKKIVVRYGGHVVVAHVGDPSLRFDGTSASFDTAPEIVAGKLFLPLRLLEALTDDSSKKP